MKAIAGAMAGLMLAMGQVHAIEEAVRPDTQVFDRQRLSVMPSEVPCLKTAGPQYRRWEIDTIFAEDGSIVYIHTYEVRRRC